MQCTRVAVQGKLKVKMYICGTCGGCDFVVENICDKVYKSRGGGATKWKFLTSYRSATSPGE